MDKRESGWQPLEDTGTGCTLVFLPSGSMYQPLSALAILAGLNARGFSGVCECYLRPDILDGVSLMGVGLAFDGEPPDEGWWGAFVDNVQDACADDEEIRLDRDACAFAAVTLLDRVVEFMPVIPPNTILPFFADFRRGQCPLLANPLPLYRATVMHVPFHTIHL